mmetsp:Transcript_26318/g.83327  ORF Transcript_26318/g.83327 Transcript_26318/m.83327 type:complete len:276 (+) Transcript_26318:728-1555(+)
MVYCGATIALMEGCCMIAWQSGHLMLLKVSRLPPVCPFRTMASTQWWCSTWPQTRRTAGAALRGSVQQMGHHSSPSGNPRPAAAGDACACDEADGVGGGGAELLVAFFLQSGWRHGRHLSSPRTPPHQWPHSACLLPQARRSFSAQDREGGNLLRSVPSSLPQQELARLSARRIFAMHGCEHHRHDPTGQACSTTAWCFCQPSQDQPQWYGETPQRQKSMSHWAQRNRERCMCLIASSRERFAPRGSSFEYEAGIIGGNDGATSEGVVGLDVWTA